VSLFNSHGRGSSHGVERRARKRGAEIPGRREANDSQRGTEKPTPHRAALPQMQFVQKWIVPAVITIVTIELWNRFLKPRLGL
jgi:hypothetical protein